MESKDNSTIKYLFNERNRSLLEQVLLRYVDSLQETYSEDDLETHFRIALIRNLLSGIEEDPYEVAKRFIGLSEKDIEESIDTIQKG